MQPTYGSQTAPRAKSWEQALTMVVLRDTSGALNRATCPLPISTNAEFSEWHFRRGSLQNLRLLIANWNVASFDAPLVRVARTEGPLRPWRCCRLSNPLRTRVCQGVGGRGGGRGREGERERHAACRQRVESCCPIILRAYSAVSGPGCSDGGPAVEVRRTAPSTLLSDSDRATRTRTRIGRLGEWTCWGVSGSPAGRFET